MKIKILSASDLHLGHPKVSSLYVIDRLKKYFLPYVEQADIVFLAGDLYHTLLHMSGVDARASLSFMIDLMKLAEEHKTKVRILRGTYTHDRDQSAMFQTIFESTKIDIDFKYWSNVSVEHIYDLDMKILYLPDDLPYASSVEVLDKVRDLMDQMGWDKLDLVCCHGYFRHVLPPGIPHEPKITYHDEQFDDILKEDGLILTGHVHTKSQKGRVIYNGSFDRLAHGEEEKKGFFFIDKSIHFIENKDATLFKTIDFSRSTETDKDVLVEQYKAELEKLVDPNEPGYVRFVHPDPEIRQIMNKVTTVAYPQLKYSQKSSNKKTSDIEIGDVDVEYVEAIHINEENLPGMILNYIRDIVDEPTELTLCQIQEILKLL